MRVPLILVAAIGFLAASGVASAEKEKVKTNQTTKLLARPGEQAKVLLTAKSGQSMTLLKQDGRWLKVRFRGRTGYVPRSKVDMADSGGIARNTRRRPFVDGRSKRRGFGGDAPEDRVGADAVGEGDEAEDEDEDEDEKEEEDAPPKRVAAKPAPKRVVKPTPKPAVKSRANEDEDEDFEDEEDEEVDELDDGEDSDIEEDGAGEDEEDEDPLADGDEPAPKVARVSKKVSVYEDPDAESEDVFVVRPTDMLYPMDSEGEWTYVENAEGDGGWLLTELLEFETEGGGKRGKRVIDVRARLGFTVIQQGMRTAGSNVLEVPDNYNIGTSSMTLGIGGGILMPYGSKYVIGGEMTYDYAKTLGGGVFYDPDGPEPMPGANIGITLHNVNVRLVGGLDLKKRSGMTVFGRVGYRYQGFLVNDVTNFAANPARLPSEVVKAPTLGAALAIPLLTEKIGIKFSLDTVLFAASMRQTKNLEDGANPSLKAIGLGASLTYRLSKSFEVIAGYDLNYMGVDFGAPVMSSLRDHMGTNVKRTDIFHTVTFGVAKPL